MTVRWNCKYMAEVKGTSEKSHNYFVIKQCKFILKTESKCAKIQKYTFEGQTTLVYQVTYSSSSYN